jgi:2-dehydropantoate 2-reductase
VTTIAVIGPGAVGSTITAWLMQNASHSVFVAIRSKLSKIELQTPDRVLVVSPQVVTDLRDAHPVDWVLVTTKAYDSQAAAEWFQGFCDTRTVVAILQNGVEHVERFAPYFPRERLLPIMVDIPAERTAPGRVHQRRNGRMIVPQGVLGARFVELFSHTPIAVSQAADFKSEVWRKLCLNAAGALSAIVLQPAVIARHDGVAQIMQSIVRECIAVGRAEGAALEDSLVQTIIDGYRSTPDSINSIHADRLAGRQMEIDARNAVIVRLGRKHGIATPVNSMVVALLEAASDDKKSCSALRKE